MDFFMNDDITITKILLACKVPAGTGATVHKNRAAHGFALNMSGEKIYFFKNRVLTVKENSIIFLPEGSDYTVKTVVPGDCYAINFKTSSSEKPEPFVLQPKNKMPITDYFISTEKIFRTKKQRLYVEMQKQFIRVALRTVQGILLNLHIFKAKRTDYASIEIYTRSVFGTKSFNKLFIRALRHEGVIFQKGVFQRMRHFPDTVHKFAKAFSSEGTAFAKRIHRGNRFKNGRI